MTDDNEKSQPRTESVTAAQELLDKTLSKLKDLGDSDQSTLFPNGVQSVDLEVGFGTQENPEFHLALKIIGAGSSADRDEEQTQIRFNAEGHHIIALIAMKDLETNSPEVFNKVQQILTDGDRTIFEAAKFADDIRNSQPQTKPFHFVDISLREGGPLEPPLPPEPHVLSKIVDFTNLLREHGNDAEENVNNLSWLIHLFGDVHQPMHCIERTNQFNPNGDRGGNGFRLKGRPNNLHSLWDSSVSIFSDTDPDDTAVNIMQEHTRESLANDLQETEPESWARNGFRLARRFAYSPLVEDPDNPPRPSTNYLRTMSQTGRRQAALGGYRLADRLKEIFG